MNGPTILVVEDEPLILTSIEDTLQDGGFDVVSYQTVEEAIAYLQSNPDAIAGLVSDIRIMGDDRTGWDLAQTAREIFPDVCVVYVSGDSASEWPSRGVPGSLFLQKPFAAAQIVTAMSTLVNGASG